MYDEKMSEVLTPNVTPHPTSNLHLANGKFAPGNPGGPGRPPRTQEQQMLDTIKATMPPARIEAAIQRALELAEETKSWRGYLAVLEFAAAYTLGRPAIRLEPEKENPIDVILAKMRVAFPSAPEG